MNGAFNNRFAGRTRTIKCCICGDDFLSMNHRNVVCIKESCKVAKYNATRNAARAKESLPL